MTQKLQLLCLDPAFFPCFPNSIDSRYNSVMSLYCLPNDYHQKIKDTDPTCSFQSFFNSNSILTRSSFDLYPFIFTTKLYYTSKNSFFFSIIIVFFFLLLLLLLSIQSLFFSFRIRSLLTESSARFGCTWCRKKRTKRTKAANTAANRAANRVANRAARRAGQRAFEKMNHLNVTHARHELWCSGEGFFRGWGWEGCSLGADSRGKKHLGPGGTSTRCDVFWLGLAWLGQVWTCLVVVVVVVGHHPRIEQ